MDNLEQLEANISEADKRLHESLGDAIIVNHDLDRKAGKLPRQ